MTVSIKEKSKSQINQIANLLQRNNYLIIWLMLLALFIFSASTSPNFLTVVNLRNILRQGSILGIVAIGQTIVLLSRGADLSISSIMTLSAVVAFDILNGNNARIPIVLLISLVIGFIGGLINGIIVSKFKVPPFLLTLGTREIIYGLALVYTGGTPTGNITPEFRKIFGQFELFGVPGQIIIWFVFIILFILLLRKTEFGRRLYATGGNPLAARQSGVKTELIITKAYIISGILAAIGGLVLAARAGYADNVIGQGYELNAVAASVIGGTAFSGGKGGIFGTIGGVLFMIMLQNILNLLGVNPSYYNLASGLAIIAAVTIFKRED